MKTRQSISHIVELDGEFLHVDRESLVPIEDPREVMGDKWLLTDFQEAISRVITVEGPVKYAELLVRRKLQESGEFEEPVAIFSHWKKKCGKNSTDVFFTAVPTRLTGFYLDELSGQEDITLVFAMYGALWRMLIRTGSKSPVAVVFRHNRFAEVLVGSKDHVYFANRCVAFDTEKEQIDALWTSVLSDIESVENDHRLSVHQVIYINWLNADEPSNWPKQWQQKLVHFDRASLQIQDERHDLSWPLVAQKQSIGSSFSPIAEKIFYYAKCWVPALNIFLVVLASALLVGLLGYRTSAYRTQQHLEEVQQQVKNIHLDVPRSMLSDDFDGYLKFVAELDRYKNSPSLQQIVDDLTQVPFAGLALQHLKVDYTSDQVRLELSGSVDEPFDRAHGGYQGFVNNLTALGYRIEESRFETQISSSNVLLKLNRPLI